jgi:tRNA threonylcarbamoyl adenosine modification protein YjeE
VNVLATSLANIVDIGDVITFAGDLGAGKTAFCRLFIQALAKEPCEVTSPTFTIVQVYDQLPVPVWHCDLYRLEDKSELLALGLEDAMDEAILLIEWPEISAGILPEDRLEINIGVDDESRRNFAMYPYGNWQKKLAALRK